jgi:two-component system chemotaxis response regulator CheB
MVVMPLKQKSLRVVMAQTEKYTYPALAEAIAAEPGIELIEIKDTLDNIWRKVITHSPDITIFYAPVFENAEKRCVNHILHGVYSSVLVLAEDTYFSHIPRASKLEVFGLVKNKTDKAFIKRIINRVKEIGPVVKDKNRRNAPGVEEAEGPDLDARLQNHIIAIGASTGGTEAMAKLFKMLPEDMPGIVVVQHMPPVFTRMYAERLDRELPFSVTEAADNIRIKPRTIHIAPGDRHLLVKRNGPHYYTHLGGTEKINGHCPSVDVLFESVAKAAGKNSTGIILTGMGADGARGLLRMKKSGAHTIGQDEESSVVYGMPKKAFDYGAVIKQVSLGEIAMHLIAHLKQINVL